MVSAGHPAAAAVAVEVLAGGGNAVDAAIAGAAVLAVVCPHACGVGGDVYAVIYWAETGELVGLNGTGRSPGKATPAAYRGGIPKTGIGSVSVPGAVAGWCDMLDRFGSRRRAEMLAPAMDLAADGFVVHGSLAQSALERQALLARNQTAWSLYGALPQGSRLRQPDLAATLGRIAEHGADGFYRGEVAAQIANTSAELGGLLSAEDLAAHESVWQPPLTAPFAGHDVATMAPNSYGITLLLQLLDPSVCQAYQDNAARVVSGLAARRRAYAAAAAVMGDPSAHDPAARGLLERIAKGNWPDGGEAIESNDRGTSNIVTMDRAGNAVSLVQSISAPFGCGVVVPDTGVLLNNRMTGFANKGGKANSIGPGLRPAHTLIPCLVLRDGVPTMAIGSPGANGQSCTLAQILRQVLVDGEPLDAAVSLPRWSVDLQGRPIYEQAMDGSLAAELTAALPRIAAMPTGWLTFGSVKAIVREEDTFFGVADRRREAATAGY